MELSKAYDIALAWQFVLHDSCERIEIAGSIRCQKPEVHDIEIVATPRTYRDFDMFGHPLKERSALDEVIGIMEAEGSIEVIKGGHKYKQIALPEGINLDLFIVTPPAEWGVIYLIRTGPKKFSRWVVTKKTEGGALPSWCQVRGGAVYNFLEGVELIPMPEEADFFKLLQLPYIPPEERVAPPHYR